MSSPKTVSKYLEILCSSVILFGHDGEMDNEEGMQHPAWAKNGSYQVVRKLKQFVPEWNRYWITFCLIQCLWTPCSNAMILSYVETQGAKLGFNPGQMGARLMGRWQSGKFKTTFKHDSSNASYIHSYILSRIHHVLRYIFNTRGPCGDVSRYRLPWACEVQRLWLWHRKPAQMPIWSTRSQSRTSKGCAQQGQVQYHASRHPLWTGA